MLGGFTGIAFATCPGCLVAGWLPGTGGRKGASRRREGAGAELVDVTAVLGGEAIRCGEGGDAVCLEGEAIRCGAGEETPCLDGEAIKGEIGEDTPCLIGGEMMVGICGGLAGGTGIPFCSGERAGAPTEPIGPGGRIVTSSMGVLALPMPGFRGTDRA